MYKACIFDLDGTLTDTLESLTYSVNATLKELLMPEITHEQCRAFVGDGARALIERALRASGDEKAVRIEEAMEAYGRIFKEYCTYRVSPYDGILELLKVLKEKGILLAVLSNKPHLQTQDVVAAYFEKGTFNYVQGQMEGIPKKPDPTAALLIAEKMGINPKECVYIGDSEVDMQTAKAAGMTSIGVTWGFRSKEVLEEHGADHIAEQAENILTLFQ